MVQHVIHALDQIHPASDGLKQYLQTTLKEVRLKRKEQLHAAGEICNNIYFVLQGLLRSYYPNSDGQETTGWFMKEGDVIVSVKSFFHQVPAHENIEAMEDSILFYVTYSELQNAYIQYPEFNVTGRILTEKYYVLSEERLASIRNEKAKDRYHFLLCNYPELLLRIPASYIASYLGIDKATLSRLKSSW
ncbi:MAG: Crp/Fnr family transcriptional regulator [Bacteroidetes bacterium]|nr:Crp/Fnr family transcriptional regulator [Bacteroidota bacterium]